MVDRKEGSSPTKCSPGAKVSLVHSPSITNENNKYTISCYKKNREKLFSYCYDRKEPVQTEIEIEAQKYFHGLLPRRYIGNRFKKPGDFLVLLKYKGGEPRYFLELLDADLIVKRIGILKDDNSYFLAIEDDDIKGFPSIPILIKYYYRHQIPGYICLKYPIQRPNTFYSHSNIKYSKNDDLIGKGTFSNVYKGLIFDGLYKGTLTAIKILDDGKKEMDKDYIRSIKKTAKFTIKEASIMEETDDKNILLFYGLCMDSLPVSLLTEYCPAGTLESHLKKEKNDICVGELLYYCYDIVKGMRHLSKLQIAHRNLSVSNVFISCSGYLKIGSFGKACKFNCTDGLGIQLNIRYQPPEYLLNKNIDLSESMDVWSYGVVVVEIFNNGSLPLQELNDEQFKERVLENNFYKFPPKCPETWSFGIKKGIFVMPPTNRFTFRHLQELLEVILKRNDLYPLPKSNESALSRRGIQRSFILL